MADGEHIHPEIEAALVALSAVTAQHQGALGAHDEMFAALITRIEALEAGPTPVVPLEIGWWAMSNETDIVTYAEAGFTHNVLWTTNVDVAYLDLLHTHGMRAYVVLEPEFVGHPAVAGTIVADEPDLIAAGVPKRTIEQVAATATQARQMWPDVVVASTMGSPLAAGPLSTTETESTEAGYWSLSVGPFNSPEDDILRFTEGYGIHIDVCWPQMYTVAGDSVQPRYRRQQPLSTIDAGIAGVRESLFVPKGVARARRLLPSSVEVGALLAPCKFHGDFGRDPTYEELIIEGTAVVDAGGTRILYFTKGGGGGLSGDLLEGAQLEIVTQAVTDLQAYFAEIQTV